MGAKRPSKPRVLLALCLAGLSTTAIPTPAGADSTLGGFVAKASATPVMIQIYEPTIPIPADPQVELKLAYTNTEAGSGPTGHGRASWAWPGDSVGEGFKTIADAFGLPEAVGKGGYPVQVNAESPGEPNSQSNAPVPGGSMRATASPTETVAKVGFSPDDDVAEDDGGAEPGLPSLPGLGGLTELLGGPADEGSGSPVLPQGLTALVDFGGMSSISRSSYGDDTVVAVGTSRLSDLSLLGGLITADSVLVSTRTTSTLSKTGTEVTSRFGGLTIAGVPFALTKDGIEAAGQSSPIPGLPDDAAKALAALGITIEPPDASKKTEGTRETVAAHGLRLTVDTKALLNQLDALKLGDLVALMPDESGQLKGLVGALVEATPKVVITLGNARSEAGVVPTLTFPAAPAPAAGSEGGAPAPAGGPGVSAPPVSDVPGAAPPIATAPLTSTPAPETVATAAGGLPPMGSIPGALLMGGLILASGLGWWLHKVGVIALGPSGSCERGLQTGVPDLRKA